MEPRKEENPEPKAPQPPTEQPKLRRFRIVKLEERIAPAAVSAVPTVSISIRCN
jgi:hypothetical protein